MGVKEACDLLGVPRSSYYRWLNPKALNIKPKRTPDFALTKQQRDEVLETLHSPEFVDMAPYEIYACLLDQGRYLCSIRTMYRLLKETHGQVHERRNQRPHTSYQRPELLATKPNQLWTWDITKLKGPSTLSYYYLYVIIDVFSRYVTGWMLAYNEDACLASDLIEQACHNQNIQPDQLTIHADNGPSMSSKTVSQLYLDLGITRSHSRPYCSNDNPFSESHFRTLKYRPAYPKRFGCIEQARQYCRDFFHWYNHHHYHSGIALLRPNDFHYGNGQSIIEARNHVLLEAAKDHPGRFKGRPPRLFSLPNAVWINPPFPAQEDPNKRNEVSPKPVRLEHKQNSQS